MNTSSGLRRSESRNKARTLVLGRAGRIFAGSLFRRDSRDLRFRLAAIPNLIRYPPGKKPGVGIAQDRLTKASVS